MTTSILFVCLGNICRSPSAEGVVRAKASARGMDLRLDSAGTGDWHVGKPPYPPMIAAAASRGYDLTDLRARQVSRADFDRFDLIVAMDDENLSDLRALRPGSGGAALIGFTDVVAGIIRGTCRTRISRAISMARSIWWSAQPTGFSTGSRRVRASAPRAAP